jgi:hypothetical protein
MYSITVMTNHPTMANSRQKTRRTQTETQVLYNDDIISEALQVDAQRTATVYILTMKNRNWKEDNSICNIDTVICRGETIEKAFTGQGYTVTANVLSFFMIPVNAWLGLAFNTGEKMARARITEYIIKKGNAVFSYGVTTEIFSPAIWSPVINKTDEMAERLPSLSLLKLLFNREEIWASPEYTSIPFHLERHCSPIVPIVKEKLNTILWEALPLLSAYL